MSTHKREHTMAPPKYLTKDSDRRSFLKEQEAFRRPVAYRDRDTPSGVSSLHMSNPLPVTVRSEVKQYSGVFPLFLDATSHGSILPPKHVMIRVSSYDMGVWRFLDLVEYLMDHEDQR
jgi:hypothetical protein